MSNNSADLGNECLPRVNYDADTEFTQIQLRHDSRRGGNTRDPSSRRAAVMGTIDISNCPDLVPSSSVSPSPSEDLDVFLRDDMSTQRNPQVLGCGSHMITRHTESKRKADTPSFGDTLLSGSAVTMSGSRKRLKRDNSDDLKIDTARNSPQSAISYQESGAPSEIVVSEPTSLSDFCNLPSPTIAMSRAMGPPEADEYGPQQAENTERNSDEVVFCPIKYRYDYLHRTAGWFKPRQLGIPASIRQQLDAQPLEIQLHTRMNSLTIQNSDFRLPLHTGLESFRQNRHWRMNIRATTELLQLFAEDERCKGAMLTDGRSMSSWAEKVLSRKVSESVSRFAIYMFPDADKERMWLLGQLVILIFIFDGKLKASVSSSCKLLLT